MALRDLMGGLIDTIVHGIDINGNSTIIRTDAVGRTKISHAQPPATTSNLTTAAQALTVSMDSLSDLIFYFTGTHAGFNLTFEQSPDSTTGTDGTWYPILAVNQGSNTAAATTTGVLTTNSTNSFAVSAPGAAYVRARVTAMTSGTLASSASGTTAARPVSSTVTLSGTAVSVSGSGSTSVAKLEDVAHASGDMGIPAWGVRAPATPASPTSAAGDYGYIVIDTEGKIVIAGTGDSAQTEQASVDLTLTTDAAILAAGAATIRHYVTDITVENTGASPARLTIDDGATRIWTCTIPAGTTIVRSWNTPLRGTAATALNGKLAAAGTVSVSVSGYKGI